MHEHDGCCGHRHGEGKRPSLTSILGKIAIAIAIIAILFISACAKAPTGTTTPIGEFRVEKLFVIDDCTVYRFLDDGRYRYFTKCVGAVSSSTESVVGSKHKYPDSNSTSYAATTAAPEEEYVLQSSKITQ